MVLAKLTGHVAERLQEVGNGRVFGAHPLGGGGRADLRQACAVDALPGDERGAARRIMDCSP